MEQFQANWNYPTQMLVGKNSSTKLMQLCQQYGMSRPLLVTDSGLLALPTVNSLINRCEKNGLNLGVYSDIKSNPTGENIERGVAYFRKGSYDGVVALGGGSVIDAAKAIAMMVGQDRPLWDFEDEGDNWERVSIENMMPVIAIPTTAGTGSEVGRASVITNEQEQRKVIIFHPDMLPKQVILDPILTLGLPPGLTAATGMDALSHNLEAFCANYYHPMAEGIASESIRIIGKHLPRAYKNGGDCESRLQMLVASSMGAAAFQKGLGGMHAIAHTLGALYDKHHGLLNAILMPYVLMANRNLISKRIARLARYLGLEKADFDGFFAWILDMRESLGVPHTLSALDIDNRQAQRVGQMSAKDPAASGNPILFTAIQYQTIFEAALQGRLDLLENGV